MILSDAHLSKEYGSAISNGLAEVLHQYEDCELVLAGDIFDLSLDAAEIEPTLSLRAAVAPHEAAVAAIRRHVQKGGKITLIPGNHDAAVADSSVQHELKRLLGIQNERSLEVAPWFLRRDGVHIEHGHLYDPDCAPNHPLAPPNPRSEGLGTALMRRFVAPHDALFFAHANQTTPISGLKKAFERWGVAAPAVVLDYFKTATNLCYETVLHRSAIEAERTAGNRALPACADQSGVPTPVLEALLRLAPAPTHHSLRSTFFRLYFDRVLAAGALGTGLSLLGAAGLGLATGAALVSPLGALTTTGALLSAVGGGYLAASTTIQKNRYGDQVIGQLHEAAQLVQHVTDSSLVVFGHTHVEVNEPNYVNLGSFGFARKRRPFLMVTRDGRPERVYHPVR